MKTLIDFFLELALRLKSKNPKIFNYISMAAVILFGLFFGADHLYELNIPDIYMGLIGGVVVGIIAMGQVPVNEDTKQKIENQLKTK